MLSRAVIVVLVLAVWPTIAMADGAVDRSFGNGGSVSFAPERFSSTVAVAVDGEGRVLVAANLDDGSGQSRAAILRLRSDGSLDPTFGAGGVARIEPPAPWGATRAEAIAVDRQGRVLVAGSAGNVDLALARLLPSGAADPAFASGGILLARSALGGAPGSWHGLALDGSSIVLAGAVENSPPFGTGLGRVAVVARVGDDGRPDPAFVSGGFLKLSVPGVTFASTRSLAIDGDGRIVLGIWRATTTDFPGDVSATVLRLTHAGALDGTFGSGGIAALGALRGSVPAISVRRSGEILALGGWVSRSGHGIAGGAQLLPDGQLDERFASDGELPSSIGTRGESVLDCQGDLLAYRRTGIARIGPDGRVDGTFKAGHAPTVPVGDTAKLADYDVVAVAPDGSVVLAGTARDGPILFGGGTTVGHSAVAVARLEAACPVADDRPPSLKLRCSAGCRRIVGTALDAPAGSGVRRVLLGIERIAGARCEAWNGRKLVALPCATAATRRVAVPVRARAFRSPPLGKGRFVIRVTALDRAGNDVHVVKRVVRS
jgi:uncharacterized delta-60 repeat protein